MSLQQSAGLISALAQPDMVDLVNRNFVPLQKMVPLRARQLFINETIGAGVGAAKLFEEYDVENFALSKPEGTSMKKTKPGLGYQKTAIAKRFGRQVDITWEMRRYAKEQEVVTAFTNLSHFVPQRMELDLTHRFTFADATSYVNLDGDTVDLTTADGLALASAVHKLAHTSTTYRNLVANNPLLSQGSFEAALDLISNQTLSNFGEVRNVTPNKLVIHNNPVSRRIAIQLLQSSTDISQVNPNVKNAWQGDVEVVVLPYLATTATGKPDSTKRDIWAIGAFNGNVTGWQSYLAIFEEPTLWTPAKGNNGENFTTQNWSFGVTGSYDIAVLSGRGIALSLPTSVATY